MRASSQSDGTRRDSAGQRWQLPEKIGWSLDSSLRISRTTSQDAGVAASSDVVVATAALEIGFNDTTVGAVVQHKSPRQMAAFVQRKGRAGRTSAMRPLMVTILSDYGRDRLTYQSYERHFDPVLVPQRLPIGNQYIVRMQAVFAFIDWLAQRHQDAGLRGWWWQPLNGPINPELSTSWRDHLQAQQTAAQTTLRALLHGDATLLDSLASHLSAALQLSREDVASVLWEAPRSLLLEVIPTLARRMYTGWATTPLLTAPLASSTTDGVAPDGVHPLPDFVPANLFSDLSLPEVTIALPPATARDSARFDTLPIASALRQLAPGRVTRRFAFERGGLSHWVTVPLDDHTQDLPVSTFATEVQYVGEVPVLDAGELRRIPCYRPRTVPVEKIPARVNATSNAFLHWGSELLPAGDGLRFPVDRTHGWGAVIQEVDFFLHAFRSPLTVRRFAIGSTANVRLRGSNVDHVVETRFTDTSSGQAAPAAVGFEQEVDGLRLRIQLPSPAEAARSAQSAPELSAWRTAYVRDRILNDAQLAAEAGWFQRDWIAQVYVSAVLAMAADGPGCTLAEATDRLHRGSPTSVFDMVLSAIFQVTPDDSDVVPSSEETPRRTAPRHGTARA